MAEFTDEMAAEFKKALEGSTLAVGAVAELLQEHQAMLKAEEDRDAEEYKKKKDEEDRASMAKSIASLVLSEVRKELGKTDQGMPGLDKNDPVRSADYDGDDNAAGKGGASDVDDSETPVSLDKTITEQQATIQAAALKKNDDGSNKYPKKESEPGDDDDDEDYDDEDYDDMKKMLKSMQAVVASIPEQIEKAAMKKTEAVLKKMGINKTDNLKSPVLISEGVLGTQDGVMPLVKADDGDLVDQLAKGLSYQQMRILEERLEAGDTSGIPQEIVNGFRSRRVN